MYVVKGHIRHTKTGATMVAAHQRAGGARASAQPPPRRPLTGPDGGPLTLYQGNDARAMHQSPEGGSEYGIFVTPRREYARKYGSSLHRTWAAVSRPKIVKDKSEISSGNLTKSDIESLQRQGFDSIVVTSGGVDTASEVILFDRRSLFEHGDLDEFRRLKEEASEHDYQSMSKASRAALSGRIGDTPAIQRETHIDQLPGGEADDLSPSDIDPDELEQGTKHESEHTSDSSLAREIAMDHIASHKPGYYDRLEAMEKTHGARLVVDVGSLVLDMAKARPSGRTLRQAGQLPLRFGGPKVDAGKQHAVKAHVRHTKSGVSMVVSHQRSGGGRKQAPSHVRLSGRDLKAAAAGGDSQAQDEIDRRAAKRAAKRATVRVKAEPPAARPEPPPPPKEGVDSPQFQAWFGDWTQGEGSRVVGPDGRPEEQHGLAPTPVFHGTPVGGFKSFSTEKDKGYNIFGKGFYFTEDREIAEEYTKKDEADKTASTTGFTIDGEQVNTLSAAQVKQILSASGFHVERASRKAWSGDPEAYDRKASSPNPNWDYNVLHAVSKATDDKGRVDLPQLIHHFWNPGTKGWDARAPTPDVGPQGGKYFIARIQKALGRKAKPDIPESEVFEVFLNIRNPVDMDAEVSAGDFTTLAQHVALQQSIQFSDHRWVENPSSLRHKESTDEQKVAARAGIARLRALGAEGKIPQPSLYLKQVLSPGDQVPGTDIEGNDFPFSYSNMVALKRYLVETTKGNTHKGRQVLGAIHEAPPEKLTWQDVHYLMSDAHNYSHGKDLFRGWAEAQGHDGIRHTGGWNIGSKAHTVWIAWAPNQIKATSSTGFDAATDDIFKGRLVISAEMLAKARTPSADALRRAGQQGFLQGGAPGQRATVKSHVRRTKSGMVSVKQHQRASAKTSPKAPPSPYLPSSDESIDAAMARVKRTDAALLQWARSGSPPKDSHRDLSGIAPPAQSGTLREATKQEVSELRAWVRSEIGGAKLSVRKASGRGVDIKRYEPFTPAEGVKIAEYLIASGWIDAKSAMSIHSHLLHPRHSASGGTSLFKHEVKDHSNHLAAVEDSIRGHKEEHAAILIGGSWHHVDPSYTRAVAKRLPHLKLDPRRHCAIPPEIMVAAKKDGNATFTHNHPTGSSLSPADIQLAGAGDFAEVRAATPSGGDWSLKRPPQGWGDPYDLEDFAKSFRDEGSAKAVRRMDAIIKHVGGDPAQGNAAEGYDNEVWHAISKQESYLAFQRLGEPLGLRMEHRAGAGGPVDPRRAAAGVHLEGLARAEAIEGEIAAAKAKAEATRYQVGSTFMGPGASISDAYNAPVGLVIADNFGSDGETGWRKLRHGSIVDEVWHPVTLEGGRWVHNPDDLRMTHRELWTSGRAADRQGQPQTIAALIKGTRLTVRA